MYRLLTAALLLTSIFSNAQAQHQHNHQPPVSSTPATQCKETTLICAKAAMPYFAPDGALWVVWSANGAISLARSKDMGKHFDPPIEIAQHGAFLDTGPDARPQLVGDEAGNMTIAYAFFKDKQWNAQVNISRSIDQGQSFSKPAPISNDPVSQRFASLAVDPQGKLFAAWIDKRLVAEAKKAGQKALGGSIAYAWSNDMGQSFSQEKIARADSCECCRIGVSMNPEGLPVMIYRAIFNGNVRDHATQLVLNETQAGPAERISNDNWETDSCPHHGPSIAVSASGTYHVTWFTEGTTRNGTFYARSSDTGKNYSVPRAIGNAKAQPARPYLLAQKDNIWLVWKEFDGKRTAVYMQLSKDDGRQWSAPKIVSETVGYSDHPLLIQKENNVYLSWLTSAQGWRLISLKENP